MACASSALRGGQGSPGSEGREAWLLGLCCSGRWRREPPRSGLARLVELEPLNDLVELEPLEDPWRCPRVDEREEEEPPRVTPLGGGWSLGDGGGEPRGSLNVHRASKALSSIPLCLYVICKGCCAQGT
jgi:hypothetical protein